MAILPRGGVLDETLNVGIFLDTVSAKYCKLCMVISHKLLQTPHIYASLHDLELRSRSQGHQSRKVGVCDSSASSFQGHRGTRVAKLGFVIHQQVLFKVAGAPE